MEHTKKREEEALKAYVEFFNQEKRRWVKRRTAGDKIHLLENSRAAYLGRESIG